MFLKYCICVNVNFSGARSRTPGRGEAPLEMTSEDLSASSVVSQEDDAAPTDNEVRVVSAVVVDEEAISAGVRAAQYNMIDELRAVISHFTPDCCHVH